MGLPVESITDRFPEATLTQTQHSYMQTSSRKHSRKHPHAPAFTWTKKIYLYRVIHTLSMLTRVCLSLIICSCPDFYSAFVHVFIILWCLCVQSYAIPEIHRFFRIQYYYCYHYYGHNILYFFRFFKRPSNINTIIIIRHQISAKKT